MKRKTVKSISDIVTGLIVGTVLGVLSLYCGYQLVSFLKFMP